jgi:hypothetical protein
MGQARSDVLKERELKRDSNTAKLPVIFHTFAFVVAGSVN